MTVQPRHQCMIYEGSPATHLPGLASVIAENLFARKRCLYLDSPAMVAGLRSYLSAAGVDVAKELATGALVLSSSLDHLKGGYFDPQTMLDMLADAVDRARNDGYAGLWAAGDMTWEFGPEKNFTKLYDYEQRLEKLFLQEPGLQGICLYHMDTLPADASRIALHTHHAVYINETLSRMSTYYCPPDPLQPVREIPPSELTRMLAEPGGSPL